MIKELLYLRELILEYHKKKEYEKSIEICMEYLEQILLEPDNSSDLWFCYYLLSYNYYLIKDYNHAIEYGKYAAFSMDRKDVTNYNRTVWHLANCYRETGNIRESVKMYYMCVKYYKKIQNQGLRMLCLYNIAKLLEMINIMEKIMYMYLRELDREDISIYEQGKYDIYVIEEMCMDIVALYENKGQKDKVSKLIKNIQKAELKDKLNGRIIENLARFI